MWQDLNRGHSALLLFLFLMGLLILCHPTPAWAHKVTIFAWVEGDTVHTQSKFSGGKRAQNSAVVVYDNEGSQLLEGKTDENGEFSFKVPKKTDLKVALKSSMGHAAEWTIPVEEITGGAESSESGVPEGDVEAGKYRDTSPMHALTGKELPGEVAMSREEIQQLIDESVERKLAPIARKMADSVDSGPGVTEVLGGIGYIFGLVGVALYFSKRQRNR